MPRPTPRRRRATAAVNVPRGMIRSVFWSFLFGYVMICSFVLAMPNVADGAKQGGNVFYLADGRTRHPGRAQGPALHRHRRLANYLCALAGMTSLSRMIFAFARDGGFPASKFAAPRQPFAPHAGRTRSGSARFWRSCRPSIRRPSSRWPPAARSSSISPTSCRSARACSPRARAWTKKGPFQLGGVFQAVRRHLGIWAPWCSSASAFSRRTTP